MRTKAGILLSGLVALGLFGISIPSASAWDHFNYNHGYSNTGWDGLFLHLGWSHGDGVYSRHSQFGAYGAGCGAANIGAYPATTGVQVGMNPYWYY